MKAILFLLLINGAGQQAIVNYEDKFDSVEECNKFLVEHLPEWRTQFEANGITVADSLCISEDELPEE